MTDSSTVLHNQLSVQTTHNYVSTIALGGCLETLDNCVGKGQNDLFGFFTATRVRAYLKMLSNSAAAIVHNSPVVSFSKGFSLCTFYYIATVWDN